MRVQNGLRWLVVAAVLGCGGDGPTDVGKGGTAAASRIGFRENRYDERGVMRDSYVSVVKADGSDYRAVTPAGHFVRAWDWHAETDRIVYVAYGVRGMFVVDGAGGTPTPIAHTMSYDEEIGSPRWSPDGSRIAFVAGSGALDATAGVHVVNADGSGLRDLTSSTESEGVPAWAPDGSRIAFSRGDGQIWTVRPDGTGITASTGLSAVASRPRWSPDGRRLVYTAEGSVWTIDAALRTPRRVTAACLPDCPGYLEVAWSPRGDRLLAHRATDTAAVVLDAATGDERARMLHARDRGEMSPDGARIAFTRWYGPAPRGLLSVASDGSDERVLWTPERGFASEARWLP